MIIHDKNAEGLHDAAVTVRKRDIAAGVSGIMQCSLSYPSSGNVK